MGRHFQFKGQLRPEAEPILVLKGLEEEASVFKSHPPLSMPKVLLRPH